VEAEAEMEDVGAAEESPSELSSSSLMGRPLSSLGAASSSEEGDAGEDEIQEGALYSGEEVNSALQVEAEAEVEGVEAEDAGRVEVVHVAEEAVRGEDEAGPVLHAKAESKGGDADPAEGAAEDVEDVDEAKGLQEAEEVEHVDEVKEVEHVYEPDIDELNCVSEVKHEEQVVEVHEVEQVAAEVLLRHWQVDWDTESEGSSVRGAARTPSRVSPPRSPRFSLGQAVETRVIDEDVHVQALESTKAHLERLGNDGILEELKAAAAAEACVRGAVEALLAGSAGLSAAARGRALSEEALRAAGVEDTEAMARVGQIVAKAVDRTIEFLEGECEDLVDMARGEPPGRVRRAIEVGVQVAVADLRKHNYVGAGRTGRAVATGQQMAQLELERLHGAASIGIRPQALRDHEAVAVWVAVRRGVLGVLGENPDSDEDSHAQVTSGRADVHARSREIALACVRDQYATTDTRLELTEEEVLRASTPMSPPWTPPRSAPMGPLVVVMERPEMLLRAARYFCSSYIRAYFEQRGKAEEGVALAAAAAVIQSKFRTHSAAGRQQHADARVFAHAIRQRNRTRGDETRLRALHVVRLQARLRGKVARARVAAMKRRAAWGGRAFDLDDLGE